MTERWFLTIVNYFMISPMSQQRAFVQAILMKFFLLILRKLILIFSCSSKELYTGKSVRIFWRSLKLH